MPARAGRAHLSALLGLCVWLSAGIAAGGMFARTVAVKESRAGKVRLSSGEVLAPATVSARRDLKVLLLVPGEKKRREIEFSRVVRLQQRVVEEGMEREWRWREGGADEKIHTGRSYPWRKYDIRLTLDTGKVVTGRLTSGFPLQVAWRAKPRLDERDRAEQDANLAELNRNIGNTMTAAQRAYLRAKLRGMQEKAKAARAVARTRTLIITPGNKGKTGQKLAQLVYVKEVDLRPSPAAGKHRDHAPNAENAKPRKRKERSRPSPPAADAGKVTP